ncbi:MAG: aminopeptidase P family protein [Acidimicrobiaceae bacterium]|nr:aminopeptidase P family protein [Acidimicrobiaceae bacterium]MXZ98561.1 aminopeptidase P family protein [Acidimicrobiaceae bacterium]MYE75569.1 aminopeptidase P family protein [Acidimicrobiaceae bacterium]MYE95942.1 aminopeptidase P family protein [Acidimicrobiaceae bacterium]MYH44686.1 aminopeptidase P family protein [Acidimicrobiaceae bacterium]
MSTPGSLGGYAKGPFSVDWEERYDMARLRRDRVAAAQRELAEAGADGLMVWKDENVRYLTSLRAQLIAGKTMALNGALLQSGEEPVLLCSGGEIDKARAGMDWIAEAHAIPIMEQAELVDGFVRGILRPILVERGLDSGRLGVDAASVSFIEALRAHLPEVEVIDGDTIMQRARLIKTDVEIAIIEEACAIGDAVTQRALDETRAGRRELEVAGDAMQTLFHLGGEMAHVITPFVASGEHMSPPHRLATDKLMRNHDLCFIDIGAMWNGYFADIGRTTVVGRPSRRQREIYTAVHEGLKAGIDKMRPGLTNADAADAVVSKIGEHGLAEHLFSLFIGHGIGVGANEPPYIGESMPGATVCEFEPNMVFAVEPLVWVPEVPGGGGVRIEDMVLVTEGEPRVLSRVEYEESLLL